MYYDNKQKEEKERELFENVYKKQSKTNSKILLITFGILGFIFLIMGIILLALGVVDEEGFNPGFVFAPMGGVFIIIGIIAALTSTKTTNVNYDKFKKRTEKYGYINVYDLTIKVEMLEKKVEELEKKINSEF